MKTIIEVLETNAKNAPERDLFAIMASKNEETIWTRGSFLAAVKRVGAKIQKLCDEDDRVVILAATRPEFPALFFGVTVSGRVAVPLAPPNIRKPAVAIAQLSRVLEDAKPAVVVAPEFAVQAMRMMPECAPLLNLAEWVSMESLVSEEGVEDFRPTPRSTEDVAFLQYTSGSTDAPRAVMVSHGNLLHQTEVFRHHVHLTEDYRIACWLPLFHDMGVIGTVVVPALVGGLSAIMSPLAFLKRPVLWLKLITRFKATHTGAPNFAYQICADRIAPIEKEDLDLSSLTSCANGAEPVQARTLENFSRAFKECGYRALAMDPGYGMAETTLTVTAIRDNDEPRIFHASSKALGERRFRQAKGHEPTIALISNGRPDMWTVKIVSEKSLEDCGPDEVGEILVSGESLTLGYFNNQAATERNYIQKDGVRFFRTGDLGFLYDGELYVTGRIKDLIIIAGRNIHPHQVESIAEASHKSIRIGCCACYAKLDESGNETVELAIEVERRWGERLWELREERRDEGYIDRALYKMEPAPLYGTEAPKLEKIANSIRSAVSEQLQVSIATLHLLVAGQIPKTTSGKIQRSRCKEMLAGDKFKVIASFRA